MLAIFESHPVQYRAPVYQELQRLVPYRFHVFYATDISVRGNRDVEFGKSVAWDEPLLEGYPHTVLKQERGEALKGFRTLRGQGISRVFDTYNFKAVLQTQFLYEYDFGVLFQAVLRRIPVWIRQETQDVAIQRSFLKSILRSLTYRMLYSPVQKAFYFGELNREHLLRNGIRPSRLVRAPYSTINRFENVSRTEYDSLRNNCRTRLGIAADKIVIAFFGKLISKKNPDLLLQAVPLLKDDLKARIALLFVGSGALEAEMRKEAGQLETLGIQSIFAGFINQSAIRDYYAASDIIVLPSRFEGETWGLVVNEALQAGCAVVVSEAVGCAQEFGGWERVRTIPTGDAKALARALIELAAYPKEFGWAQEALKPYSTTAVAEALAGEIQRLPT